MLNTPDPVAGRPPSGPADGPLAGEHDLHVLRHRVVDLAVSAIHGCRWASLTQLQDGELQTTAATAPLVGAVDAAQFRLGEGPSLDAFLAVDTCLVPDTSDEIRWPSWCRTARILGVGSVLSVRLATPTRKVGALNLYASRPRAFRDPDVHDAHLLAAHAANALARTHEISAVETSLEARHIIKFAQEILMAADHRLTLGEAFRTLRQAAEISDTGLRRVAEGVIERRSDSLPRPRGATGHGAGGQM